MKGIAGVIYSDVFQVTNLIVPMLDSLGHCCDKIQDISNYKNVQIGGCGHKIFSNFKKTVHTTLDGTLYNSLQLKQELVQLGYLSTKEVPSDIILYGYEEWGTKLFAKLRGDFAFVIFDQVREKIFLVRDRIGKKPLYWYHDQHHFIFASELKSILATGAISQTIARDSIAAYLYFGFIPQDMTPVKDVNKLLPAHYLELDLLGTKQIQPYWSYSSYFGNPTPSQTSDYQIFNRCLTESVELRILDAKKYEEPIGSFISGGLGSASIAYYLKNQLSNYPMIGFSVGFEGENEEDIQIAKEVSQALHVPHQYEMITPNHFLDSLVKMIWYLDEPLADPNIIATWQISKLASLQTHSVFSGMGCDELLSGHERYNLIEHKISTFERLKLTLQNLLRPLLKYLYKPAAFAILKKTSTNPLQFEFFEQNAIFNQKLFSKAAPKLNGVFDPEVFLHKFQNLYNFQSSLAASLYLDVKTRLVDCFILQYERFTTAHSLDWYTPYLDRYVVEFLTSLHDPKLSDNGKTKDMLKSVLKSVFPENVLARPKKNRPHFLNSWIQNPSILEVFQLLPKGLLVENGIISQEWISKAINNPKISFRILFSILTLEIWYRLFINQPILPIAPEIKVKNFLNK